jgi:hypothetical protein
MAYVALLNLPCDRDLCHERATRQVIGRDRVVRGIFCREHAERVCHETDKEETRLDRKDRKAAATGAIPVVAEPKDELS